MDAIPVEKSLDQLDQRYEHMVLTLDESRDVDRTHV